MPTLTNTDLDIILASYFEAMLWATNDTDNSDCTLDEIYDNDDISPELLASSKEDIKAFYNTAFSIFANYNVSMELGQVGHDFFLTRCGHGAGFWDRGLGKAGDKLTEACKAYGSIDPYAGDDGLIYI